jgi:hypothetical protein
MIVVMSMIVVIMLMALALMLHVLDVLNMFHVPFFRVMALFHGATFFFAMVLHLAAFHFVTLPLVVMRGVHVVVPVVRHEIHGAIARVVLVAMNSPMPLMSRGYVKVERLRRWDADDYAGRNSNNGPRNDQLRGRRAATDRDGAEDAGDGDVDCNTYVCQGGGRREAHEPGDGASYE